MGVWNWDYGEFEIIYFYNFKGKILVMREWGKLKIRSLERRRLRNWEVKILEI